MPTGTPTKTKKCPICGDTFLPERPSQRYCKKDHFQPCPVCGKPVLWNSTRPVPSCSKECKKELIRRRNVEKYGVDHPMKTQATKEKQHRTMEGRYGTAHALCNEELKARAVKTNREKFGTDWALGSPEVHNKIKQTMTERYGPPTTFQSDQLVSKIRETNLEKYGCENAALSEQVQKKIRATNKARYGFENPMQNKYVAKKAGQTRHEHADEINEKIREAFMRNYGVPNCRQSPIVIAKIRKTLREHYGVDTLMHSPEIRERVNRTCMEKYGVPWYCMTEEFQNKRPPYTYKSGCISKTNRRFAKRLQDIGLEVVFERKLDNRQFYDIEVVGQNTLIEIDPSYTHNIEGLNHWNRKVDPLYHLNKTQVANEHGYRCIHVFDWDDWEKIVSLVAPRTTRIGARKCGIVRIVDQKVANKFIRENHVQGQARGAVLTLGLEHDNELVMCMSFGRSRYNRKYTYELLRLCSKKGVEVVAGASKLFKFATNQMELDSIVSYCDLAKFSGDVYEKIGMTLVNRSAPNVVWSRENKHVTSNLLRQRGYDQLFNTNYGKGTDNEILMLLNGWVPVCDCGQGVYEYVLHS